ncbi:30S ribosomal protein S16 [Acidimicrobium ferrooxidans]|nr:30S ribosomal protein S16 [Acidimicrobium ferrooxidans]
MAVRLRLTRMGRKNRPFYRICAFDSRTARDGRSIEILGHYDPLVDDKEKATVVNTERVKHWLSVGAKPSETVASILKKHGVEIPKKSRKKSKKAGTSKQGT